MTLHHVVVGLVIGILSLTFAMGMFYIITGHHSTKPNHVKTPTETTVEAPPTPEPLPQTTPATLNVSEVSVNGPIQILSMKDNTNDKEYIIIVGNTGVAITPRIPK